MAALPTINEAIQYADVAIGLCANDNAAGSLWGKRLTAPSSPVTQAIVCDALRWARDGGAVAATQLRQMANYLLWLINPYGLTAKQLISGGGGGTVIPPPSVVIFPFIITSANFESDGVSYNNPNIVGVSLSIFIDEYNQQWLTAPTSFIYTSTGIKIIAVGFDANSFSYTIMIQKIGTG